MLALPIRHAESLDNCGQDPRPDSGLSDLGRRQAERLARRLVAIVSYGPPGSQNVPRGSKNESPGLSRRSSALYSSPYRRAIETAEPIAAALGLPIRVRPELCEYQAGTELDLTGFSIPSIATLSRQFTGVGPDPDDPGPRPWPLFGETLADLVARQRALVRHLRARWTADDDLVVLIGHGSPVARFIEAWLTDQPGPSFRFVIENAAVNCVRYAGGVSSLLCLGDVGHLHGLPPARGSNVTSDGGFNPRAPAAAGPPLSSFPRSAG